MSNAATATQSKTQTVRRRFSCSWQGILSGSCLAAIALLTGLNSPLLERSERQMQTLFFELRGPQAAPDDIVILAIDQESLSQGEHYASQPQDFPNLAPIQQWPWQRQAYAIAIERLMQAEARAVALDVLLVTESSYGAVDDQALATVLSQYGDRVVLAALYQTDSLRQGSLLQPTLPLPLFRQTGIQVGTINFWQELNGRIHRQGYTYLQALQETHADLDARSQLAPDWQTLQSFAEATLTAAQLSYPPPRGTDIQFRGPAQTFQHIPFWYVLDTDLWQTYLKNGAVFQDKIVLIGSTARQHQDFHATPFGGSTAYPEPLAGVEILANDIATLRAGNALRWGLPHPVARAALGVGLGVGLILGLGRCRRTLHRLGWTCAGTAAWLSLSYVSFVAVHLWLPTASIALTLLGVGLCHSLTGLVSEQLRRQRLRATLAQYVTSPIVQEIISQEEEFQDLLQARQAQLVGTLLGGRYQVLEVLGTGGFSETYTAADRQRPGHPTCVVKQLKIVSDDPKAHALALRLFEAEAETLERLGHHPQIPRLLAHFEANSAFYLVEEMVPGSMLKTELASRHPKSQAWVMNFLLDILPVVEFVHSQGVIHRDIKPSNIIRRAGDGRLVLIDFGSVKQISNQIADTDMQVTSTIGIGTKGYMPSEQSAGMPRFSSDLYAIGVTAIEALTGLSPYKMTYDDRGELIWQYQVPDLNPALATILYNMVRYDFSRRYASATEVLAALREIPVTLPDAALIHDHVAARLNRSDDDEDRWDEPTGCLPTDWMTDSTEKNSPSGPAMSEDAPR